jgi:hypothetical protein
MNPNPSRKMFQPLRIGAVDGVVRLRFYLSTPLFVEISNKPQDVVIRVYRRTAPEFVFGEDYAEYFDGAAPRAEDRIFEGTLAAINRRKFEFEDHAVEVGQTYMYWVSTDRGDWPVGPVAVKVRNPEVWWTAARLDARLDGLAKEHPRRVAITAYGRTVCGRALRGLVAGRGAKTLALVGAVHAGESGPELIVPAIERLLREDAGLLEKVRVAALPSVNLDVRERLANGVPWYIRKNANDVDLNRNFDVNWEQTDAMYGLLSGDPDARTYHGAAPTSEPETRAVVDFVQAVKPAAIFSYHWLGSISGDGCMAATSAKTDETFCSSATRLLSTYSQAFLQDPASQKTPFYGCTPGSFPEWAYSKGIPCFDVEGDRKRTIEQAGAHDLVTVEMLREYQDRHYRAIRAVLELLARETDAK